MFKRIKKQVKWFIQRRTRGFDDRELWDLGDTIAKFIIPRLEAFRDIEKSFSPDFNQDSFTAWKTGRVDGDELSVWFAVVDKMLQSFQMVLENDFFNDDGHQITVNKSKVQYAREGLCLFSSYFQHLWD